MFQYNKTTQIFSHNAAHSRSLDVLKPFLSKTESNVFFIADDFEKGATHQDTRGEMKKKPANESSTSSIIETDMLQSYGQAKSSNAT